jgi:hypothetical protein
MAGPAVGYLALELPAGKRLLTRRGDPFCDATQFPAEF